MPEKFYDRLQCFVKIKFLSLEGQSTGNIFVIQWNVKSVFPEEEIKHIYLLKYFSLRCFVTSMPCFLNGSRITDSQICGEVLYNIYVCHWWCHKIDCDQDENIAQLSFP